MDPNVKEHIAKLRSAVIKSEERLLRDPELKAFISTSDFVHPKTKVITALDRVHINTETNNVKLMVYRDVGWVIDENCTQCMVCNKSFSRVFRTKHHCVACGNMICFECSTTNVLVQEIPEIGPQRICRNCCDNIDDENSLHPSVPCKTNRPPLLSSHGSPASTSGGNGGGSHNKKGQLNMAGDLEEQKSNSRSSSFSVSMPDTPVPYQLQQQQRSPITPACTTTTGNSRLMSGGTSAQTPSSALSNKGNNGVDEQGNKILSTAVARAAASLASNSSSHSTVNMNSPTTESSMITSEKDSEAITQQDASFTSSYYQQSATAIAATAMMASSSASAKTTVSSSGTIGTTTVMMAAGESGFLPMPIGQMQSKNSNQIQQAQLQNMQLSAHHYGADGHDNDESNIVEKISLLNLSSYENILHYTGLFAIWTVSASLVGLLQILYNSLSFTYQFTLTIFTLLIASLGSSLTTLLLAKGYHVALLQEGEQQADGGEGRSISTIRVDVIILFFICIILTPLYMLLIAYLAQLTLVIEPERYVIFDYYYGQIMIVGLTGCFLGWRNLYGRVFLSNGNNSNRGGSSSSNRLLDIQPLQLATTVDLWKSILSFTGLALLFLLTGSIIDDNKTIPESFMESMSMLLTCICLSYPVFSTLLKHHPYRHRFDWSLPAATTSSIQQHSLLIHSRMAMIDYLVMCTLYWLIPIVSTLLLYGLSKAGSGLGIWQDAKIGDFVDYYYGMIFLFITSFIVLMICWLVKTIGLIICGGGGIVESTSQLKGSNGFGRSEYQTIE